MTKIERENTELKKSIFFLYISYKKMKKIEENEKI